MKILQLLTPMTDVKWLSIMDTVRDAFDHMETYGLNAAPIVDWNGCYVGTLTLADLRRHVTRTPLGSFVSPLSDVERRSTNVAVTIDVDEDVLVSHAAVHPFVPVIDDTKRLLGIIERGRVHDTRLPSAA